MLLASILCFRFSDLSVFLPISMSIFLSVFFFVLLHGLVSFFLVQWLIPHHFSFYIALPVQSLFPYVYFMVGMSESRSLPSLTSRILDLFQNLFYKHTTGIKYSPFNLLQSIKQIRDLKVAKEEQDIGFYAGFVGEQCLLFFTIGISRLISSTEMFIYSLHIKSHAFQYRIV